MRLHEYIRKVNGVAIRASPYYLEETADVKPERNLSRSLDSGSGEASHQGTVNPSQAGPCDLGINRTLPGQ